MNIHMLTNSYKVDFCSHMSDDSHLTYVQTKRSVKRDKWMDTRSGAPDMVANAELVKPALSSK